MMAAVLRPRPQDAERLRLQALEQMTRALCERIGRLIRRDPLRRAEASREAELQRAAFEERRDRALAYLETERSEPVSVRIGNLEKLVEALECSRAYFNAAAADEGDCAHVLQRRSADAR